MPQCPENRCLVQSLRAITQPFVAFWDYSFYGYIWINLSQSTYPRYMWTFSYYFEANFPLISNKFSTFWEDISSETLFNLFDFFLSSYCSTMTFGTIAKPSIFKTSVIPHSLFCRPYLTGKPFVWEAAIMLELISSLIWARWLPICQILFWLYFIKLLSQIITFSSQNYICSSVGIFLSSVNFFVFYLIQSSLVNSASPAKIRKIFSVFFLFFFFWSSTSCLLILLEYYWVFFSNISNNA